MEKEGAAGRSNAPAPPPVPPVAKQHGSAQGNTPALKLPPPVTRKTAPPPVPTRPGEQTQQTVQDVFKEFIKQEKQLLGKCG